MAKKVESLAATSERGRGARRAAALGKRQHSIKADDAKAPLIVTSAVFYILSFMKLLRKTQHFSWVTFQCWVIKTEAMRRVSVVVKPAETAFIPSCVGKAAHGSQRKAAAPPTGLHQQKYPMRELVNAAFLGER